MTPRARDGLQRIALDVQDRFGTAVAERVLERTARVFELLVDAPEVGHARADLDRDEEVRFWAVGATLVAYRVQPPELVVLLIERGERDWERLLDEAGQ